MARPDLPQELVLAVGPACAGATCAGLVGGGSGWWAAPPRPFALEQRRPGEKAAIAGSWHRKPRPVSVRPAAHGLCELSSWERSGLLLP